mmetsp:Transcript_61021/g.97034  ORF Transcript_61021/g.97034 Transcript_61021/m.97034 type:complete len:220 (-) Transcript_61021:1237-1896(-)
MHRMAKLMEESHHIVVRQQRRFIRRRLWEIAQQHIDRQLLSALLAVFVIDVATSLQRDLAGMAIFTFSRMEIEKEVTHQLLALAVLHLIQQHLIVPKLKLRLFLFDLQELDTQQRLVDIQRSVDHRLDREKRPQRFLVNGKLAPFSHATVISEIVFMNHSVKLLLVRLFFLLLEFQQRRHIRLGQRLHFRVQIVQEIRHCLRCLRHPRLQHIVSVTRFA